MIYPRPGRSPRRQEPPSQPLRKAETASERWWSLYADPVLDRLIDEALEHNADAKIAAARVLQARALAKATDADLYPTVSAGLTGKRTKSSELGTYPLGSMPAHPERSHRHSRRQL